MYSRYKNIRKLVNNSELYDEILTNKSSSFLEHYAINKFEALKKTNLDSMPKIFHVVQPFERLYNISNLYYRSPEFGWVILYTNNLSSEIHIMEGMTLTIYLNIAKLLGLQ
jgi:hypothetical protein